MSINRDTASVLSGLTTPPLFDNDNSIATTAFVQQQGLHFNGWDVYQSSPVNLTAASVGKLTYLGNYTSNGIVNMPAVESVVPGSVIVLYSPNASNITVNASAGNAFSGVQLLAPGVGQTSVSSFTMKYGESVILVAADATTWMAIGGSKSLVGTTAFYGSLGGDNGYQRLPSGLIIQWGVVSCPANYVANTFVNFSYPLVFPTAVVNLTAVNIGANTLSPSMQCDKWSASQGRVLWSQNQAGAGGLMSNYIAIGF